MKLEIEQILPLLLRPFESLSSEEIERVRGVYESEGRDVFESALFKQARPYASLVLSRINCDSDYWASAHQQYVERNSRILEYVEKVSSDFIALGGKTMCVYENYGTVLSSSISIGCFASGDVDFSVNENELSLAIEAIEMNGFKRNNRSDHTQKSQLMIIQFFNPEVIPGGYWFNIMRVPVIRSSMFKHKRYLERLTNIRASELENYKDTNVKLLPPTAMVYYNSLHFAAEHYYSASPGMALCCDIDRVARNRQVDWGQIEQWSKEDKAGIRFQLALDVCKYFLHSPIPDGLFENKSSCYQRLWNRIIDEKNGLLISQDGKLSRLYVELLSDDKPLLISLLSRLFMK